MANVFSRIINSYVHIEELESIDKNKQILNTSNFISKLEENSNNVLVLDKVSFRYFNSSFKTFNKISLKIEKRKTLRCKWAERSRKKHIACFVCRDTHPK